MQDHVNHRLLSLLVLDTNIDQLSKMGKRQQRENFFSFSNAKHLTFTRAVRMQSACSGNTVCPKPIAGRDDVAEQVRQVEAQPPTLVLRVSSTIAMIRCSEESASYARMLYAVVASIDEELEQLVFYGLVCGIHSAA